MPEMDPTQPASHETMEQIAVRLADGFDSLLSELQSLGERERQLTRQLDFAKNQYRELNLDPTLFELECAHERKPDTKVSRFPATGEDLPPALDEVAERYDLKDVFLASRNLKADSVLRKSKHWQDPTKGKCKGFTRDIEEDFTTSNGIPGTLECPFANMADADLGHSPIDPIAAELHSAGSVGPGSAYAQQHPNKCPIRYLNQHSPEEVAEYFEKHKHEIPRSHALCVSRYRQNDTKIRQLDAKYGNLQNMIQSLGVSHQQYLSAKDGEENVPGETSQPTAASVEKWAENVSQKPQDEGPIILEPLKDGGGQHDSVQTPQCEKPLREIRVGESPSRPWGISIPAAQEPAESAIASADLEGIEPLSLSTPEETNGRPGGKQDDTAKGCPMGHGTKGFHGADQEGFAAKKSLPKPTPIKGESHPPQVVFNGPVFFGYSAEQVVSLMKSGVFGSAIP